MAYTASMNGFPWTKSKMKKALEQLKQGGSVTFAFGGEDLSVLPDLNEMVFKARPDLFLHVWSVADDYLITNDELEVLTCMNNVNCLYLNGFSNLTLQPLGNMQQLKRLKIGPKKKLDLSFIEQLKRLEYIHLSGSFTKLESLAHCTGLKEVYLSTTINSFVFFESLTNLQKVNIDSCIAFDDFAALNKPSLKQLSITSIKNLETLETLAGFEHLQALKIDASRVELLPSMKRLKSLTKLELGYMKVWKNPEAVKELPKLEELTLHEINTKLKAEDFFFLTEMNTLKTVDFRFMDFNERRIKILTNYFINAGKTDLLKE